jgi:prepilin-type N-terminal cleavage/methylation domain-containing protein
MMRKEDGFSLVELLVALTVTLIVSGAIYGLLTSGSAAFRREPELADRQQNIRVAMDVVARDVFNAGAALPRFSQVFTLVDSVGGRCTGAQGLNGCGGAGALGPAAAGARAPGDGGDPSANTDVVELLTVDETCPLQTVCVAPGGPPGTIGLAGTYASQQRVPACLPLPGLVLLANNDFFSVHPAQGVGSGGGVPCPGGSVTNNGSVLLGNAVQSEWSWTGTGGTGAEPLPTFLHGARVVRYTIAPSTDPQELAPALWRSTTGRFASDGSPVADPGGAGFPGAGSGWQIVARGIEDLQLEYMAGDGLWHNRPPLSVTDDWTTLVRRVRITLSARAAAPNMPGATIAGGAGPDAVRGQLVTEVAPRAAFNELQMGGQIQ